MTALLRPSQQLMTASGRSLVVQEWRGEGSYARIYRGELLPGPRGGERRDCAVKLAKREVEGAVSFLEREGEALGRGPFMNTVELLDLGSAGAPFLALSWLEGTSLRELVTQRRQLPLVQALRLFADAAAGIAALHRAGVAHADLRPDNVVVIERGAGARLLDLGSALLRADPGYPAGTRQDLERLGDLLHVMLTGATAGAAAARLTPGTGHHPEAAALYAATRGPGVTADEVHRKADNLLERLGASAPAAGRRLR